MIACIKIILLILMLYSSSYSQQGGIGDIMGGLMPGSSSNHDYLYTRPKINGDTIELIQDRTYALFSGTFQKIERESYAYRDFKVNSIIRGSIDTTTNNKSIVRVYNLKICTDIEFELNQNYLILDVIKYDVPRISPFIPRLINCNDILPDSPANRETLINKFENKVIINEP